MGLPSSKVIPESLVFFLSPSDFIFVTTSSLNWNHDCFLGIESSKALEIQWESLTPYHRPVLHSDHGRRLLLCAKGCLLAHTNCLLLAEGSLLWRIDSYQEWWGTRSYIWTFSFPWWKSRIRSDAKKNAVLVVAGLAEYTLLHPGAHRTAGNDTYHLWWACAHSTKKFKFTYQHRLSSLLAASLLNNLQVCNCSKINGHVNQQLADVSDNCHTSNLISNSRKSVVFSER